VEDGGTLLVADTHLTGPGADALGLPKMGVVAESNSYAWRGMEGKSQRFRYRPVEGGMPLATADGKCFCAAVDRGKGRLIVLSIPRGLGIDKSAHPILPLLIAHVTSGLTPIQVQGDVEWMLNRTATGWIVTLFNPAGQDKPQHGITPTDYRQNRTVTIRTTRPVAGASDWLAPDDALTVKDGELKLTVLAGSVRVVELKEK
jgi:hypothetical protein